MLPDDPGVRHPVAVLEQAGHFGRGGPRAPDGRGWRIISAVDRQCRSLLIAGLATDGDCSGPAEAESVLGAKASVHLGAKAGVWKARLPFGKRLSKNSLYSASR